MPSASDGFAEEKPADCSVGTVDLIPCPEYTGDGPFFQGFLLMVSQKVHLSCSEQDCAATLPR
jgi:hypothetical protein